MASKECLKEEVASLVRVRNRLTKTEDSVLPKILSGLLPKVLVRLEESLAVQWRVQDDLEHQRLVLLAQQHLNGILHHGLERMRGNSDLVTDAILAAVAPFMNSKNEVVGTWSVTYAQQGISRCRRDTLTTSVTSTLIQVIDHYHGILIQRADEDDTPSVASSAGMTRLTSSSWLFLDCIIMTSGLKPFIDWDMDSFEEKDMQWKTQKSEFWGRLASDVDIAAAALNGSGVFHLLLDLLLFRPDEVAAYSGISVAGEARICHRSQISSDDMEFARRQRRGLRSVGIVENKWSDMAERYLRHLKLVALRYSIWPMGHGLLQGNNMDKALVLGILFSGQNSMHGRLAADFLKKFKSEDTTTSTKSFTRGIQTSKLKYSINVALALLILMVGESSSSPLLLEFESKNRQAPWAPVLGGIIIDPSWHRPALPSSISKRVVDFMLRHRLAMERTATDKEAMRLLINLTVLMAKRPEGDGSPELLDERKNGKFLGVQLIDAFLDCECLSVGSESCTPPGDAWTTSVIRTGLGVAVELISLVVEIGEAEGERSRVGSREERPGGVPAPFEGRHDLNRMLNLHRASQKRRKLATDEAVQARKVAYSLIERYAWHAIRREERPFQLAADLLRCAMYEEDCLQQHVSRTSKALLEVYARFVKTMEWQKVCPNFVIDGSLGSLQQAVAPLLPALLDSACSDPPCARLLMIEWACRLVRFMDPEASLYLLSFLKDDNYGQVASLASKAASQIGTVPSTKKNTNGEKPILYLDRSSTMGQLELKLLVQHNVNHVSQKLGEAPERAQVLLFDFKFSIKNLFAAVELEKEKTFDSSGFNLLVSKHQGAGEGCCGICYDELLVEDGVALDCCHYFCRECWIQYLVTLSKQGKYDRLKCRCPQQDCNLRVLPTHLEVIDKAQWIEWEETYLKAFLDHSCQECPNMYCQLVATRSLKEDSGSAASCCCPSCNQEFCFGCGEVPHEPATCEVMAEWSSIQHKSDFYVRKNSRPCPGCHAPIEKTQGCNHMTCPCDVQFCWLCLTVLSRHSESHTCNRYSPIAHSADNDERRALFVAERYEAHRMAEEFAASQLESTQKRPEQLIETFSFLAGEDETVFCDALLVLCRARNYLRNSYIQSYGLRENRSGLDVLENYQGALEMLTERLSQLTETNLPLLFMQKGEGAIKRHFHGLGFFSASVANYIVRFNDALREST